MSSLGHWWRGSENLPEIQLAYSTASASWVVIYIYIYSERERERERWTNQKLFYYIRKFSNTPQWRRINLKLINIYSFQVIYLHVCVCVCVCFLRIYIYIYIYIYIILSKETIQYLQLVYSNLINRFYSFVWRSPQKYCLSKWFLKFHWIFIYTNRIKYIPKFSSRKREIYIKSFSSEKIRNVLTISNTITFYYVVCLILLTCSFKC